MDLSKSCVPTIEQIQDEKPNLIFSAKKKDLHFPGSQVLSVPAYATGRNTIERVELSLARVESTKSMSEEIASIAKLDVLRMKGGTIVGSNLKDLFIAVSQAVVIQLILMELSWASYGDVHHAWLS
ncbi:hypothetical protein EDD21DRAFT_349335 [Dissophora ornata]|nr:hypothetical protein EDD21DRAFT_349335 [Dissophora ornata]